MPRLLAAIYDRFMLKTEDAGLAAWRSELLSGLGGEVIEIGAGTGLNLPHYGPTLTRLVLAEPDRHMRSRLSRKVDTLADPVEVLDATAEDLGVPDQSFDAVVSTLVLCSVADLHRSLAEVFRVLRPGGGLVFIEHVVAVDNPGRVKWQRRIEPLWKRIAGNCHCTRDTLSAIRATGFQVEQLTRESMRKTYPWVRPSVRGIARKPSDGQAAQSRLAT